MSLTSKGDFIIGSTYFKAKTLKVTYESLQGEDSGRTDDGTMVIDWVLRVVPKIEITMPPCTAEEVSKLFSLVQGREYNITYFDALANAEKTTTCYTSGSGVDVYSGILYNGLYQDVSFNAIAIGGEA